ncbi:biotin/lipoyl-binding protein, partial [Pectobacterium parmentieri]|uniref:biotin/lipoyl-binding protein n=1 Tax=Pectobacterium parmentieri TaxID=1905730 RepID=UPI00301AFEE7
MSSITIHDDLKRQGRRVSVIIWLSLLGLVVFFVWAKFAVLDEVSVGTGKVTPSTRAQVIESLDGGIIGQLYVQQGNVVEKGQVLAQLDINRFQSVYGEAFSRVQTLRASAERLYAELSGEPLKFSAETMKEPALAARERQLYESRLRNRDETIANLQQSMRLVEQELRMTEL